MTLLLPQRHISFLVLPVKFLKERKKETNQKKSWMGDGCQNLNKPHYFARFSPTPHMPSSVCGNSFIWSFSCLCHHVTEMFKSRGYCILGQSLCGSTWCRILQNELFQDPSLTLRSTAYLCGSVCLDFSREDYWLNHNTNNSGKQTSPNGRKNPESYYQGILFQSMLQLPLWLYDSISSKQLVGAQQK